MLIQSDLQTCLQPGFPDRGTEPAAFEANVMKKASSRLIAYAIAAPLCFALGGCDTLSEHVKPSSQMSATYHASAPRSQPGDKIKLVVYGEDKMSGDFEIGRASCRERVSNCV